MFGCYRTGDANDPETYVAAVTAVLARYPKEVITAVTHPVTGIVVQIKWLPSVMEVREACERAMAPIRLREDWKRGTAQQLADRKREEQERENRPTMEELKAKYGPDWGLTSLSSKSKAPPKRAPTPEQLSHHYKHYGLAFKPKHHQDLEDHIDRGFSPGSV